MSRITVVTGGNKGKCVDQLLVLSQQGIGLGISRALSKEPNLHLILTARNSELGLAAVSELHSQGFKNVEFLQLDIDNQNSINIASEIVKSKYGGIDILINNAGKNK